MSDDGPRSDRVCGGDNRPLSARVHTIVRCLDHVHDSTNGPAAAGFKARRDGSGEKNPTGDHFSTGFNVGFLLPGRGE